MAVEIHVLPASGIGIEARHAVLIRTTQSKAVPQSGHREVGGPASSGSIALVAQGAIPLGKRSDHHAVPRRENLVVTAGMYALPARSD